MLTVCISLVFDSKYGQFRIICSLLCSVIADTIEFDPHSIQYQKHLVNTQGRSQPDNCGGGGAIFMYSCSALLFCFEGM